MNRYFIVFYTFQNHNLSTGMGNASITTDNNEMFKSKYFSQTIINSNDFKSIVITNFIELNEKEFNEYYQI